MSVIFAGLKNIGKHDKKNPNSNTSKATLTWLVLLLAADGNATEVNVPGYGVINGWQFDLNPTSVQSSFTFGDVKALQLAIQREAASTEDDGVHAYSAGNTFIYSPSSGQLFAFSGPPPLVVTASGPNVAGDFRKMCIVPIDGIQPGIISVFIEADFLNGALVQPPNYAQLKISVTAFNYDVPPVSVQ